MDSPGPSSVPHPAPALILIYRFALKRGKSSSRNGIFLFNRVSVYIVFFSFLSQASTGPFVVGPTSRFTRLYSTSRAAENFFLWER